MAKNSIDIEVNLTGEGLELFQEACDEIEQLKENLEIAIKALEFYAGIPKKYINNLNISKDINSGGKTAKEALRKVKGKE